ncbi:hypothetical protein JXB41_02625 [Candidatus Woesearchaeota archaeon]|nr:hypothetical protein [Candidatus Woesearchaeota archaeon]
MKKITLLIPVVIVILIVSSLFLFREGFILLKNKITGAAELDTYVLILILNESNCSAVFEQGWNLISVPCATTITGVTDVFYSVNSSLFSVHEYDPTDASDPWKAFNPALPSWVVQDLTEIDRKKGYWINMNYSSNFTLSSSTATPNYIELYRGWNLIGYPTLTPKNITETLQSIGTNYDIIYLYNASDPTDEWKEYTWNTSKTSDQDLNYTSPYYGYWINMLVDDTLLIDW